MNELNKFKDVHGNHQMMIIIVKWCSGIACDWCALLDIANILALKLLQKLTEL